jgi:hypothetical protein
MILSDSTIESVIMANRQKKSESEHEATPREYQVRRLVELPLFRQMIATQYANVLPLFESEFMHKALLCEREQQLAEQYIELHGKWLHAVDIMGEYSARTEARFMVWPPEFPAMDAPKVDTALRLRWTAPDQRMFLSRKERRANAYYDMNGFVPDPQAAHDEFKARVCWTEEERVIFVEIYRQHEKDFKRIKAAIPGKTYKEVIEFYYLNRYPLNLRDSEGARKRGKRKVILEGAVKRTY